MIERYKVKDISSLWSEKEKLYYKYGFRPFGKMYWLNSHRPLSETPTGYSKTNLKKLTKKEFNEIKSLHRQSYKNISFKRDSAEWNEIKNIDSIK